MHLLSGPLDVEPYATEARSENPASGRVGLAELAERVSLLEAELDALKAEVRTKTER